MTLAQESITGSRKLIRHAEEALANGDLPRASRQAWRAAAHGVKAVARQREWAHGTHYQLSEMVGRLTDETGDNEIRRFFSIAESLHFNSYNVWMPERAVHTGIEDVKLLLDKLTDIYEDGIRE